MRALSALAAVLALCANAGAAVHRVAPGASIADAIRAAAPGDTVRIEHGDYAERLVIDKPLTLEGIGRPTVRGGFSGDVIRVRAADVTIRGLIVRDSGTDQTAQNSGIYLEPGSHRATVQDCDIVYNLFGVWVEKADDARVQRNIITGRRDLQSTLRGNGVQLYNSAGAQVLDNHISYARDGIYVDLSRKSVFRGNRIHHLRYGTHYMNTHDSVWENNEVYMNRGGLALMEVRRLTVRNNVAWGNTDHGIMLRTIQDSVVENNVVAGNGRGFFIYDAEYNTLHANLVVNNEVGVHLSAGSSNNKIDGNDFIGNQNQVKFVAARDVEWGKSQGNYWSNYSGWDQNGDGKGDVPYEANDVVDRLNWQYPLLKLVLSSPSVQTLRFVARQFPVLRAPSVVDKHPRTRPLNQDWRKWSDKRPHRGE
ncbi:MAG TPA: nitrous oxide reductase family maturation protein NosD [Noviherbaspirillum sp.]|uniref:nitrous oxide reductase family maturation protein NosD n=1 Tax=Noviherbaspirillum sp. TaxID=1926288 RepID=UPI002D673E41|nr:nitrous oxide reductase family maturation protein NosD [Noviherbaspirillum sp.]HYD95885.1 nitrous oxide reductase family maturation protein NosD [Noviherbaspirillum sp.]